MSFIPRSFVPSNRKITYASFVCDYKPQKTDPYCIRLVVGGDKLDYDSDAGSPAASLLETKLLLNSVISDAQKGARFSCADLKDFFLATPMERPEYMGINWKHIPEDIREQYKLYDLKSGDYVYVKIKKRHVWPQTGSNPSLEQPCQQLSTTWLSSYPQFSWYVGTCDPLYQILPLRR